MMLVLSRIRHPERSAAKSKDPNAFNLTLTARTVQPQNRVLRHREAKVGLQDLRG
jgi:hypothetical protein